MIKNFIIVVKPTPLWTDYFNTDNTSFNFKDNHPLKQLFNQDEITFIHPINCKQPIQSFGLYKNVDPSKLSVSDINLKSYMDPGDHDNSVKTIVYFNEKIENSSIRFGKEFYFKRFERSCLKSEISQTAFNYSFFSTNFFESDNAIGEDVRLFDLEVRKNNSFGLAGWINPIILKINIDGNLIKDLNKINKKEMSPRNTLSFFLEETSLIAIEPVLTEDISIQIEWLEALQCEKIKKGPLSLIESLFLTRNSIGKAWKPFIALDGLEGKFWIEDHGNICKSNKKITKCWSPPDKTISNNLIWYANYWLKLYSGIYKNISYKNNREIFQPSQQSYNKNQLSNGIPVDDNKLKLEGPTSVLELINLYEQSDYWKLIIQTEKHLLCTLKKILKKFNYINGLNKCHLPFLWVKKGFLYFDDLEFLEYFAQEYIAPKSHILIKLPMEILKSNSKKEALKFETNIKNRYIDLVNSPRWGGAQLLLKLSKNISEDLKRELSLFDYKRGWWVKWYDSLFSCSEDINIKLYPVNSRRIGKMMLGNFRLGSKSDIYRQDKYFGF